MDEPTDDNVVQLNPYDPDREENRYQETRTDLTEVIDTLDVDDLPGYKAAVRDMALDPSDREIIVQGVQKKQKELQGVAIPLPTLRKEMAGVGRNVVVAAQDKPRWCKPWVWVANHNCFYNIDTDTYASPQTFDMAHSSDVPEIKPRPRATLFVSQHALVPLVQSPVYLPSEPDKMVFVNGHRCINTFNQNTLPKMAEGYTEAGQDYLDMVEDHIRMICGSAKNAEILTQWLAYQVQFPGRKILWSPLIQSAEGVGKSFLGDVLRCGLGMGNVGVVNPQQLTTTFNNWAGGVCVNVLEELKIRGHNRHEALNALKPLITDKFIQINTKGVSAYTLPNVTNYIAFTNSMDALPLSAADRRWWVIQCPLVHFSEVPDHENYFRKLFDGLLDHAEEVCLWLREYEISDKFLNMKQAPMTDAKALMVATEEASFDGLSEVREVIETGGYLFDEEIISSADLFSEVKAEYPDLYLHTHKRSQILKRLGYQVMKDRIKIDGRMKQFWGKGAITAEGIKAKWPKKIKPAGNFPAVMSKSSTEERKDHN
jgi:hypothetical protein